jgi:ABC-2 type transport system permease protein
VTDSTLSTPREIYDSAKRGSIALEELRGIWQYRDLISQLIRRDIVARYKRSVLGIAWTMVQPLGMMVVLTIVFSQLFSLVKGYPVYLLSGLLAWTFFSQTTNAAIHQIVWGGALLNRIYMPRTAFTISAIGTGVVNLLLSLIPLGLIALVVDHPLRLSILFLPISILLLAAFALGIGLLLSTLAISFPDVADMYQIVLLGWMYLTPVIYPEQIVPDSYRFVFVLNPMYHLLRVFREPIYDGVLPDGRTLVLGVIIALATLITGWLLFSWRADRFAYQA